jgi:hypothetical protein
MCGVNQWQMCYMVHELLRSFVLSAEDLPGLPEVRRWTPRSQLSMHDRPSKLEFYHPLLRRPKLLKPLRQKLPIRPRPHLPRQRKHRPVHLLQPMLQHRPIDFN